MHQTLQKVRQSLSPSHRLSTGLLELVIDARPGLLHSVKAGAHFRTNLGLCYLLRSLLLCVLPLPALA